MPAGGASLFSYGNSVYVAVAPNSTSVFVSPNGTSWVKYTLPSSANWKGLAFGSGVFFTAAYNTATSYSSTDGINWTLRTLPTTPHWGLIYASSKFFAFPMSTAVVAESPDAISWATGVLPAAAWWRGAAYGGGTVIIVASSTTVAARYTAIPKLSGTVKDSANSPAARTVRAYRRSDGALSGSVVSNATTGAFSIDTPDFTAHYVICLDDNLDENALIFDNVLPT